MDDISCPDWRAAYWHRPDLDPALTCLAMMDGLVAAFSLALTDALPTGPVPLSTSLSGPLSTVGMLLCEIFSSPVFLIRRSGGMLGGNITGHHGFATLS